MAYQTEGEGIKLVIVEIGTIFTNLGFSNTH